MNEPSCVQVYHVFRCLILIFILICNKSAVYLSQEIESYYYILSNDVLNSNKTLSFKRLKNKYTIHKLMGDRVFVCFHCIY